MSNTANILVDHYQKTYELTFEMWKQRNRTFLILLAIISVATLLTFRAPEANSLLVDLVAKLVGLSDAKRIEQLRSSFSVRLIAECSSYCSVLPDGESLSSCPVCLKELQLLEQGGRGDPTTSQFAARRSCVHQGEYLLLDKPRSLTKAW